jgi:hypothetical protein
MQSIVLTVLVPSPHVAKELFGSVQPQSWSDASDGMSLSVEGVRTAPGMSSADIILSVIISFGTGVPAGVLANYIYSRMTKGKASVAIPGQASVAVTEQQIHDLVEKSIRSAIGGPASSVGDIKH